MEAPVCALVDAMFRLPGKLDALLVRHGHMLPRGAAEEIPLIKQDLENMVAILQAYHQPGAQDPAMMVKCLTKEVRELSYDMEDSIDQYEHATGTRRWILSPRRKKYKITRRRGKTAWWLPEKLKWRLWMANKIREFSVRSQEALQRYSLFDHLGVTGISSSTAASSSTRCDKSFGSWHPTPYGEPVGIDAPLKKLEAWLDKNGEQKLKVVSVVGPGGVGKTMLANELYRRIGGQFECRAFVRTSRKPDVRRLLVSMLSQVRPHQNPHTWKVHSLIADIRTHLQDKRYFIVIDDIWDTQTWDIINRALPDGNLCSGILITTTVEDVALKCCGYDSKYVFTMKPLGHDDSSKLFFDTAFGPKYECPPEQVSVANSIIRKCAGLPLAMVIVANILVSQIGKPAQWDYVNKSLDYGLRTNTSSEGMKQVLNLSYNSLPEHLKACVMYLTIYEEDYIIQKGDMVKQWIAEGFICATEEKNKEEISRSYFYELIRTRMIQPVHINDNDDVLSCTVHYMVLDFVRRKSIEENFVTAVDYCQTTARLADKVRRLSLHFGNAEATSPTNVRLSQVRTLAYFGGFKCLPPILEFGLLQVLIVHLWSDDESISFDLSRISKLFRLRYLHVTCNATLEVPQTQMRGLQYLETLKIDARVSAVPSDIVHLPGLLHLSLPAETNLPNGIGHLASLWTLGYFDLSVNSIRNVQSLGDLTNLRDLRLTFSTVCFCYPKGKMDNMGSVLAKLRNLRSLTLEPSSNLDVEPSNMSISCDGLSIISSPPAFLRRFEWLPRICTFSSLPKWIGHLEKLCILKIGICKLVSNDIDVLRGLPALTVLLLYVQTKPAKRIVFNKTGFSVVKYFKFWCSVPWLEFEVDTMPNLRRFKLGFDAHGADQHDTIPLGIEHLSGLKEISAEIGGRSADDPDRTAAESALSYAIKMHPAHPTFNIQHVNLMFPGKNEYNSSLQEEEHVTLQKQYEFMEEDSVEQHQVLQKDSREDAYRRKPKLRKKWMTQTRVGSVDDTGYLDDGFSWSKYGQKDNILGAKYPRGYYRCTHRNEKNKKLCTATKQIQRTDIDPLLFDVVYHGEHTCAQSAHSLLHHGQVAISSSKINSEVISGSGSVAGVRFMSPRPFNSQITSDAISGSGSAQLLENMPFRTASGTFKDGELRLNQRGLQLISDENGDELQSTNIKVEDVQLSMDDLEMIQVIGKGSGGVVQLVQHKWVGTFYALKGIQMNIQDAVRKQIVPQIVQELKIYQATQSPHIVSCHQSFYHNGVIYLVLEYMDRGSLADIIKQVKTILEPYLAVLCKQVLEGLLYLHRERHVIHRDIKPSNLLFNHKGEVKITDFGVSAVLAGSIGQRDAFVGTYNYMAPERISGSSYDYKSDVWSLGLVILECAIGRFPYIPPEGEGWLSFYELLEAIVDQPPPSAPADQFSPEFCSFISSCIQNDPAERMSASELLNHAFIKKFEGQDLDLKILVESLEPPMNVPE